MSGLLDFLKTPEGQGLLSATFGGLAGARRGQPLNSIGRAGLAGLAGYSGAQDRMGEAERQKQADEMRQLQMQQIRRQMTTQEAADAEKQRIDGLVKNALMPVSGVNANAVSGVTGPRPEAAAVIGTQPAVNWQSLVAQGVPVDRVEQLAKVPTIGKQKIKQIETVSINGKPMKVGIDEFGQQVAQIGMEWKPLERVDMGGHVALYDPTDPTGAPKKFGDKTMTAAERDASARGWASVSQGAQRLSLDRQRATADQGAGVTDLGGETQATLTKTYGKAPAGFRWKQDGSMEFIPGGPADQKAQLQKSGEGTVGAVVADLRDKYDILDKEGAIVSTGNRVGTNIGARLSSTGLGQTLAGAVGTKSQSARDSIAMTRPLLLQAIMKATGMSAKQMDSNAELKLYLATATDPTLGLEANKQALDRIESLYGGGKPSGGASGSWEPSSKASAISAGGWSATLKK